MARTLRITTFRNDQDVSTLNRWAEDLSVRIGTLERARTQTIVSKSPIVGTTVPASNTLLVVKSIVVVDKNLLIPSTLRVVFEDGGLWAINDGVTVTFNGAIDAPLSQIFRLSGTGTVNFSQSTRILEVYPQWWGAKGQKAAQHVTSVAGSTTITMPGGRYDLFESADVGKTIRVILRAGAAALEDFETTISSVLSPTQAVIGQAAVNTATTGELYWFPTTDDSTAAIQAAINSKASRIRLVKGAYVVTNTITNDRITSAFVGDGTDRSILVARKSNLLDAILFTDIKGGFRMQDFSAVGSGMDNVSGGTIRFNHADLDNVQGLIVDNVQVRHTPGSGFVVNTPILSTIRNSKVNFSAGHGFHIIGGTTTDLINDYGITLIGAGIIVEGSAAIIGIQGGATEAAGIGVLIRDSFSVTVDHHDVEELVDRAFAAPAAAPTLTATAGGTVTPGNYFWKFAWMHGVAPSFASPESLVVTTTAANGTITANLGTVPANTFVARIYSTLVNGASGSEGFLKDVTGLVPGTTGIATKTTPIVIGAVPPTFTYNGHGYVVSNSQKVSIGKSHSRSLPVAASRHYLITDGSREVLIDKPRILNTIVPTFDIEFTTLNVQNCELISEISQSRVADGGINTLKRNGTTLISTGPFNVITNDTITFTAGGLNNDIVITPSGTGIVRTSRDLLALSGTFTGGTPAGTGGLKIGNTTSATATNGTGEAVKTNVEGYLVVNLNGVNVNVPYFK